MDKRLFKDLNCNWVMPPTKLPKPGRLSRAFRGLAAWWRRPSKHEIWVGNSLKVYLGTTISKNLTGTANGIDRVRDVLRGIRTVHPTQGPIYTANDLVKMDKILPTVVRGLLSKSDQELMEWIGWQKSTPKTP